MKEYQIIQLKKGKEQSVKRRHPWIFTGAIKEIKTDIEDGSIVEIIDSEGDFLALGHYSKGPSIAVRLFSFDKVEINYNFWKTILENAYNLRQLMLSKTTNTNIYRLIHGEGDGLPGLIVDIYDRTAVLQFHSIGMWQERENVKTAIEDIYGGNLKTIYNKSSSTMPNAFKDLIQDEFLKGTDHRTTIEEYGHKFIVDWVEGQKTGFFIDQRENRLLFKRYAENRKVCNLFGYTGGFSVYALAGGAKKVDTVDYSKTAIEMAVQNCELNFPGTDKHNAVVDDAFSYLSKTDEKYNLIVLDPPAFAKHQNSLENAIKGYKRLNQIAFEKIEKQGILFTFSCSQAVSTAEFRKTVFVAAANSKRNIKILHQLHQPIDHPVNIFHPESEYLKGLVLFVE